MAKPRKAEVGDLRVTVQGTDARWERQTIRNGRLRWEEIGVGRWDEQRGFWALPASVSADGAVKALEDQIKRAAE